MRKARIHNEKIDIIVSAQEVLEEKYDRRCDFVDPEYEFRVTFVSSSKNHGDPYFRLYYSLEDYQNMTPERKTRYDILKNQDHYQESKWHREWEMSVSSFCINEYYVKDPKTTKYKRTDAFYEPYKMCIEFQHSYIADDFKERNEFYSQLGYKVIWLYDLTKHNAKINGNFVELVEDNACGFFRIAEEDNDLKESPVFVETKDGRIFEVEKLLRKEINNDKQSTIRFFERSTVFGNRDSFIKALKDCDKSLFVYETQKTVQQDSKPVSSAGECKSIIDLWDESYSFMVVKNKQTSNIFFVFGKEGRLYRDRYSGKVRCKYAYFDYETRRYQETGSNYYNLPDENEKIWILLRSIKDKGYEERIAKEKAEKEKAEQERIAKMKETKQLKAAEREDCQTIFQLTKACNSKHLYVDNVFTGKRYYVKIVNSYTSFNIYEVDKDNDSEIIGHSLNGTLYRHYQYKVWKKADV